MSVKVIELKAVLMRSNPAVIRQFTIPEQATVKQLQAVLQILIGRTGHDGYIRNKEGEVLQKETVADIFAQKEDVIYTIINSLRLRLTFLGWREQEEPYPMPVRWRGFHLPQEMEDIKTFNRLQRYWEGNGQRYYGSNHFYYYDKKEYIFSERTIERELKFYFQAQNGADPAGNIGKLCYENSIDLEESLDIRTVAQLREIAKRQGLSLPANIYKRKLVEELQKHLSRKEVFEDSIRYMTMGEYFCLKECATVDGEEIEPGFLHTALADLVDAGLADLCEDDYDGEAEVLLTGELLDFYGEWLSEGKESAFLKNAQVYTVICACVYLYGYLSKSDWLRLSPFWFGAQKTRKELERDWDEFFAHCLQHTEDGVVCYLPEILYNGRELDEETLESMLKKWDRKEFYQPSLAELEKIEKYGIGFDQQEEQRLLDFLMRKCWLWEGEARRNVSRFYHALRYHVEKNVFLRFFQKLSGVSNQKLLQQLWELLEEMRPNVRQISYGGYTQKEYEALKK